MRPLVSNALHSLGLGLIDDLPEEEDEGIDELELEWNDVNAAGNSGTGGESWLDLQVTCIPLSYYITSVVVVLYLHLCSSLAPSSVLIEETYAHLGLMLVQHFPEVVVGSWPHEIHHLTNTRGV